MLGVTTLLTNLLINQKYISIFFNEIALVKFYYLNNWVADGQNLHSQIIFMI